MLRRRLTPLRLLVFAVTVAVLWRAYTAVVPTGADVLPWTLARIDGPTFVSPSGSRTVTVHFNDVGGAHSGNHWTWVVENSWWKGKRVVAEGYLGAAERFGESPVPLRWGTGDAIIVSFRDGRRLPAQNASTTELRDDLLRSGIWGRRTAVEKPKNTNHIPEVPEQAALDRTTFLHL